MIIIPDCLSCMKSEMGLLVCSAYTAGIPKRIRDGARCALFIQDPSAPPPLGRRPNPKTTAKHPF